MAALTPAELGAVIGHEWGHVCRRDPLRIALLRFWSTALWFLPIVRRLARDSARAMEDAADDAAVFLTEQPLELAAALVKTAKAQVQLHWSPVPALGGAQVVTERVERLLELAPASPPRQNAPPWVTSAMIATCLFGLLLLPKQSVVAAISAVPFTSQPIRMTCHTDMLQR
jgi:beta-lactamase regulating signal transducer with metallopeptidase domain